MADPAPNTDQTQDQPPPQRVVDMPSMLAKAKGGNVVAFPGGGGLGAATAGIDQAVAQKQAALSPVLAEIDQASKEGREAVRDAKAKLAPVSDTPPPQPTVTSAAQAFGSPAVMFAMLASAFTHTPMMNSMNAAAAAINAIHAGDQHNYDIAYQTWKDQTDLALKRHEQQSQDLRLALDEAKSNIEAGTAKLQAYSQVYGDQLIAATTKAGLFMQAAQIAASRENTAASLRMQQKQLDQSLQLHREEMALKIAEKEADPKYMAAKAMAAQFGGADKVPQEQWVKLQRDLSQQTLAGIQANTYNAMVAAGKSPEEAMAKVLSDSKPLSASARKEADAQTLAEAQFEKEAGRAPTVADAARMAEIRVEQRRNSAGIISDDAATLVAERVLAGDRGALVGMARSSANITKVNDFVAKMAKEKGISGEKIAMIQAEYTGVTTEERVLGTREAQVAFIGKELKEFVPLAVENSKNVDRSRYPTINSVMMAAEEGTGDENVVKFAHSVNSLVLMYSRFISPNGVSTDALREDAKKILNQYWSAGQFQAVSDQILNRELPIAEHAVRATRQGIREDIQSLSGEQSTPAPAPVAKPGGGFEEGKVYIDKNGNKATYKNGQWQEVP